MLGAVNGLEGDAHVGLQRGWIEPARKHLHRVGARQRSVELHLRRQAHGDGLPELAGQAVAAVHVRARIERDGRGEGCVGRVVVRRGNVLYRAAVALHVAAASVRRAHAPRVLHELVHEVRVAAAGHAVNGRVRAHEAGCAALLHDRLPRRVKCVAEVVRGNILVAREAVVLDLVGGCVLDGDNDLQVAVAARAAVAALLRPRHNGRAESASRPRVFRVRLDLAAPARLEGNNRMGMTRKGGGGTGGPEGSKG